MFTAAKKTVLADLRCSRKSHERHQVIMKNTKSMMKVEAPQVHR